MVKIIMLKLSGGVIYAENFNIGQNVILEEGVQFGFPDRPIKSLILGDDIFIGSHSKLYSPNLTILDYSKIHNSALIYGRNDCFIGYNAWFGQGCIVDCEGGVKIGNGFGAGANSQLWSHVRHGDTLYGNRYLSFGKLIIDDDVWMVGHCLVSPIRARSRSMALLGSVVTRDMEENHIYGGCPVKDLTDKLDHPYRVTTPEWRQQELQKRLQVFYLKYPEYQKAFPIDIVLEFDIESDNTQFNVTTREYTKRRRPEEIQFMKFLLPEAKFVPCLNV